MRALVIAAYVALVLVPVLLPFVTLITPASGSGPSASRTAPPLWDWALRGPLMARSLGLATTVALGTLFAALPLALLLYRARLPLRWLWLGALLVPLLVPPYILGTGVLHLLTPRLAIGFAGSAVTLSLWLLPLALLFAGAGLRLVTRAHEEAALLDTTPVGVLRHVTLPRAFPHALAGGLCIFVLALVESGVPALFQYRVYPGAIFAELAAFYDFRRAVVTTLPLLAVAVLAAVAAQAFWQGTERESAADPPAAFALGSAGPLTAFGLTLFTLALLSPLVEVAAGVESGAALLRALCSVWLQALRTLGTALLGAAGALLLALLVAWAATRLRLFGSRALLAAQLPLFAVPAVIVGLGLIQFWNQPDWRGTVYTSPLILVLGYVARFTPLAVPLLVASYRQLPRELDEAAQLDGARPEVVLRRIHVPLLRPVLATAGLLVFVLCVGEVPVSMLVAPPGQTPLAVGFFTLITNAPADQVAALSVITTLLALLPVGAWLCLETWSSNAQQTP